MSGVAVIACVVLILVLIVRVALPLFVAAQAEELHAFDQLPGVDDASILAISLDDYLETSALFTSDGRCVFFDVRSGEVIGEKPLDGTGVIESVESLANGGFAVRRADGNVYLYEVVFRADFGDDGERVITPLLNAGPVLAGPGSEINVELTRVAANGDEKHVRADVLAQGEIRLLSQTTTEDILGNVSNVAQEARLASDTNGDVTAVCLDGKGETLFVAYRNGFLTRWDIRDAEEPTQTDQVQAAPPETPITSLAMVFGDISVIVGDSTGNLSTWMMVRPDGGEGAEKVLRRIHEIPPHTGAVEMLRPSLRNKGFLSFGEDNRLRYNHMTSARMLVAMNGDDLSGVVGMSARGNGLLAATDQGGLELWALDIPHPESSWTTLLSRVWYERYDEPDYVWQSSAASDDFEPKLSLIPLFFGSLKATFYAMFLAVPLALFGAIYTSQFAQDRVRNAVKSTVEIMAAVPSVVIGFLAALWFAPLVERHVLVFLFAFIVFPMTFLAFMVTYTRIQNWRFTKSAEHGFEFAAVIPIIVMAAIASYGISHVVEITVCGGDFKQWLFEVAGERYDQRNSIIIAFALGFAVIPIVFTISEDALSSVPFSLKAASLALSATRWQTVWRVILPSASPGIFAGIMIGFGRAVGETMIVLMATGNTPIIDWSAFNGMRTISANIAVEIPEAPVNGTLYRVLFLYAVVLFCLTFFANTVAEVVRQRLRKKYGQF